MANIKRLLQPFGKEKEKSMNVLVINCGSSSLKYQLINSDSEEVLAKGLCERIGIDGRLVYQKEGCEKEITESPMPTQDRKSVV